jgi:hypothetical protein
MSILWQKGELSDRASMLYRLYCCGDNPYLLLIM